MSTLHLTPDGAFCGGTLLPRKVKQQPPVMTVFVNGQPIKPVIPIYAKCIICSTEVLLNPPIPQKHLDADYEKIPNA